MKYNNLSSCDSLWFFPLAATVIVAIVVEIQSFNNNAFFSVNINDDKVLLL